MFLSVILVAMPAQELAPISGRDVRTRGLRGNKLLVRSVIFASFLLLSVNLLGTPISFAENSSHTLQESFQKAAQEFGVPEDILLSVSYNLSRWEDHHGEPSASGGYGPMHLTHVDAASLSYETREKMKKKLHISDDSLHTLDIVANELHVSREELKNNPEQNIRGGAFLLKKYARETLGEAPSSESDWYAAVAKYVGGEQEDVISDFADMVYETIRNGESRTTTDGQEVTLPAKEIKQNKAMLYLLRLRRHWKSDAECPRDLRCKWTPAAYEQNDPNDTFNYGNYELSNREKNDLDIKYIVIHDTEIPYTTAINIFQNPLTYVSSHYIIRSSDGEVTQMVKNKNIALQAGNWWINMHSIGIEHEGYAIDGATWYTEFMYRSSARLTRWLAHKYDIPLDRAHIVGHDEYVGPTAWHTSNMHWDPGTYWNWDHYMRLVGAPVKRLPFVTFPHRVAGVVTINPKFEDNHNAVKTCDGTDTLLPAQPSNFVHLYTSPSFDSPLLDDPALSGDGTIRACDWGDKAAIGQEFYRLERQGDWDAIYFGGQKAWLYNPQNNPVATPYLKKYTLVTPKTGLESIPVYGRAYPELSAYHSTDPEAIQPILSLQYTIPAGQKYVVIDNVGSDY